MSLYDLNRLVDRYSQCASRNEGYTCRDQINEGLERMFALEPTAFTVVPGGSKQSLILIPGMTVRSFSSLGETRWLCTLIRTYRSATTGTGVMAVIQRIERPWKHPSKLSAGWVIPYVPIETRATEGSES